MRKQIKNLLIHECLINGKWCKSVSGKFIEVINPANGKLVGKVPDMGRAETKSAITAAHEAFPKWKFKTAEERSILLRKWHDLIIDNIDILAAILTTEQGKPLLEAKSEIKYAASFIEWYAEEAKRIYGSNIPSHLKDSKIIVTKEPVGVCGLIAPWNFPAAMITRKVAPALAVGCTAVIKPASATPFTALALGKLAVMAGIEAGVINIITGSAEEIGKELTENNLVKKISFTGSTEVGKLLMKNSSSSLKKISLELGGNAPLIVFEDADLNLAVKGVIVSKFRNSGQTCICANRIIVQEKIHDKFIAKLIAKVRKLKIGDGMNPSINQGPLINEKAVKHCLNLVRDATTNGGNVIIGGKKHEIGNNFFEPTIITNANKKMKFFSEEIFGPIAPIYKFKSEKEAIEIANDTIFGLASYIYSNDVNRAWRVADSLEYGMVGINEVAISTTVAPFGGIKESGIGREGSYMGALEYLETKYLLFGNTDR